jgi:leader peptidase (prepilin peptidase)/N-methyltransferase
VIERAAGADAPLWAILLVAAAGGALGWVTGRALRTGGYRIESDQVMGWPRAPWWPAPALAVVWGFLAWRIGDLAGWAALPAFLLFGWLAITLIWIDADVHRLPDGLVLPAYPALGALLLVASATSGEWRAMLVALACMAGAYSLYFVMALISPASLGFGDVKLAGLIGLVLGWLGVPVALLGLMAGFVVGGVIALVFLLARRAGWKSQIAFGPAMLIGALVGLGVQFQILTSAAGA